MTLPNISVKLATLTDLPDLRSLWRAFVDDQRITYPVGVAASIDTFTRQAAIAMAAEPPTVVCFLAYQGTVPVGFLLYEPQTRIFGDPSHFGFIHYLYLDPAVRHRGLATMLATLAGEHMIAAGLSHCEITTKPDDTQWADLGFIPYETRSYVACTTALGLVAERQRRAAARHGNGLDHSVTEAPSPDAPPAEEPAEE
jgi:ribosomal protein S18 acetylase RimI-like enzyme